jgi:hypothetical protein
MSMTTDILLHLSPGEQEVILVHEHDDGVRLLPGQAHHLALLWSQADDHEDGTDGTDDFTLNKSHPLFLIIYRSFGQNHRFPNKL